MPTSTKQSAALPNFFGGLGYLSIILQWLWSTALLLPTLLENDGFKALFVPDTSERVTQQGTIIAQDSLFMIIVAVIVTATVLIITLVIVIKLPIELVNTSKKSVDAAVETILPVVTRHDKKLTKKKRQFLSVQLRKYIKLSLCLVPLLPFVLLTTIDFGLDKSIALLIGCLLAVGTLVWFGVQYITARVMQLPENKLI